MNQIHVLLSLHNVHVLLRHESDKHVLLSIHNVHDLFRYE